MAADAPVRAFVQLIRSSEELRPLRDAISGASGEIVDVGRGFADELLLDVRDDAGRTWGVGTQASHWRVVDAGGETVLSDDAPAAEVDAWLVAAKGRRGDWSVDDRLDLVCRLDGDQMLVVEAKAEAAGFDDPPHWEVFTPDRTVIAAGPGWSWSSVPADVPVSDFAPLKTRQRAPRDPLYRLLLGGLGAVLVATPLLSFAEGAVVAVLAGAVLLVATAFYPHLEAVIGGRRLGGRLHARAGATPSAEPRRGRFG